MSLPASLKSRYFIDGFYSPIKLFNSQEISKVNSEYQKYVKKFGKDGVLEGDYRFRVHLLARWAHELVTHPLLVAAVKTVLDTNNILCWSSDICRKPAHSRGIISWHQDSAYSGLEPSDAVVTAWVALSPSTRDTGAVVMWPGSQARTLQHARGESEGGCGKTMETALVGETAASGELGTSGTGAEEEVRRVSDRRRVSMVAGWYSTSILTKQTS